MLFLLSHLSAGRSSDLLGEGDSVIADDGFEIAYDLNSKSKNFWNLHSILSSHLVKVIEYFGVVVGFKRILVCWTLPSSKLLIMPLLCVMQSR